MKNTWAVTCSIIGLLKLPILVLQLCQRLPASGTVSVGVHALLQTLQHAADRAESEQVVAKQLLCWSAEMAYRSVISLRNSLAELVTPHRWPARCTRECCMAWVAPCRSENTTITSNASSRQQRAALTINGAVEATKQVALTLTCLFCFLAQCQLALQLQPISNGPHKRHALPQCLNQVN